MIIRAIFFFLQLAIGINVLAAGSGGAKLLDANVDIGHQNSLQRGAQTYFNYCAGCHSIKYMRYNRMADDLGLSEETVKKNLMFANQKIGDNINVSMSPDEAAEWFGVTPPDLSVISRVRGEDWLFSFLNGFYVDSSKPTGVNNLFFKDTAMPHVLWELQGYRTLDENSDLQLATHSLETVVPGKLTQSEYEELTRDLVSFLVYVGEPARLVRYKIGFWVIAFLGLLFIFAYFTKKEIWKDVN